MVGVDLWMILVGVLELPFSSGVLGFGLLLALPHIWQSTTSEDFNLSYMLLSCE